MVDPCTLKLASGARWVLVCRDSRFGGLTWDGMGGACMVHEFPLFCSSYFTGGLGLGPRGVMERMDIIQNEDMSATSFRRDWEGDGCTELGAADALQAKNCPNTADNSRYRHKKKDEL